MGNYVLNISVIAVISSVICILAPAKYYKFISFISALAVMLVILSPLSEIKSISLSLPDSSDGQTKSDNDTNEIAARALSRSIYESTEALVGTSDIIENITVKTDGESNFTVTEVQILVRKGSIENIDTLKSELRNLYGVNIVINEKDP